MVKNWHSMTEEEVGTELNVDLGVGLSSAEALKRLDQYGANIWGERSATPPWRIFINQFFNYMVPVLGLAALLSYLFGESIDALVILVILILNAVIGFIQEYRAENALAALMNLHTPAASVVRDGQVMSVAVETLVLGDIIILEEGNRVPADLRLIQSTRLQVDESVLTGESLPAEKSHGLVYSPETELGDRSNSVYMGTVVTQGVARGVVIGTGKATQMGQISELLETEVERDTPLSRRMEEMGKVLLGVAGGLIVLYGLIGLWKGYRLNTIVHTGVSLAVAIIPEGLPAIVTVTMALGVQRLIRRNALVRRLPAVETLGSASVICTDKTGTLTENRMTVDTLWSGFEELKVLADNSRLKGLFDSTEDTKEVDRYVNWKLLLLCGVLCNNATVRGTENKNVISNNGTGYDRWIVEGDPTEGALLIAAAKAGWNGEVLREWTRLKEYPFESSRQQMSVIAEKGQGSRPVLFVKGGPEQVLERCTTWKTESGEIQSFNEDDRTRLMEANRTMAGQAMRVLAFAFRWLDRDTDFPEEDDQSNLTFIGFMGMIDPPRKGVKEAIQNCQRAGIKVVMITGDQPATAEAIARNLGLMVGNSQVVNGKELAQMDDESFAKNVHKIRVYARATPQQKLRIVRAWQASKQVVAMTGDGVNDAPAVKAADIGIAMGQKGTDVTKEVASLVLVDDNFNTIAAAVEEGRGIYENIRKTVRYLLGGNVGELITMILAVMVGLPLPLAALQILWINLLTDGLPAVALGVDSNERNLMLAAPRPTTEGIFAKGLGVKIMNRGIMIGLVSLGMFSWSLNRYPGDLEIAQTIAFATLATAQLVHAYDARCSMSIFRRNPFSNQSLNVTVLLSFLLLLAVIYVPVLQRLFHTRPLPSAVWGIILLASLVPSLTMSFVTEVRNKLTTTNSVSS